MAGLFIVPVDPGNPHQRVTTTLDGRPYRFAFDWNGRIGRWFFDLETGSGVVLVRSRCLVQRCDLLRQYRYDPAVPQGALALSDTTGQDREASFSSFGVEHRLLYFSTL